MKSGFDSSGVSRDTSRVETAGLELSESGIQRMERLTYSLDRFQFYQPVYHSQLVNSTLGNTGTAIQNLHFSPQFNGGLNWGFETFLPYTLELKNTRFYDAQSPYTEAAYTQGSKQEAFFRILHTQNVGKSFNFGIEFQRVNSPGTYLRQTAVHSALRMNFWFRPGTERYQALAGIVYHKGASFENGGLTSESDSIYQTNTVPNRQLYAVNLEKARNKVFRNGFLLRQTYDLIRPAKDSSGHLQEGAIFRLQHTIQYNLNRYSYDDENPGNAYYPVVVDSSRGFVDYFATQWESEAALLKLSTVADTAKQMRWEAKAFLKQQPVHVWMVIPLNGAAYKLQFINQSVGGKIDYSIRPSLKFQAATEAFYAGYNSGDLHLSSAVVIRPVRFVELTAGVESFRQEPVYQLKRFISNFGSWNTTFKKINLLRVFGNIELPQINTSIQVSNQLISNWVLMGENAQPLQATTNRNVFTAQLEHKLHVKKWHLYSRILFQQSNGNSQIRLPALQFQESIFREGRISKTTPWRMGIDVMGCTAFYANAYQPQSGLFYLQNSHKNSGLLQANVYVSVKIRRARIFAMLEHFNAGMGGMIADLIPYYPLSDRLVKIGFNWVFFD